MPLTTRSKVLLLGGIAAAGVGLAIAWPKKASAATLPEAAPEPAAPTPTDGMPWMRYSSMTQSRQRAFNNWARQNGFETIAEDGVLGPITCGAFSAWIVFGGPALPTDCAGHPTNYSSGGTDYGYGTRIEE